MKRKALILFLGSKWLRTLVTASISSGATWLVAKGLPPEFQGEFIATGTAMVTLGINILAESIKDKGAGEIQDAINPALSTSDKLDRDRVILPGGKTVRAVRAGANAIDTPIHPRQPKPINGGRGHH